MVCDIVNVIHDVILTRFQYWTIQIFKYKNSTSTNKKREKFEHEKIRTDNLKKETRLRLIFMIVILASGMSVLDIKKEKGGTLSIARYVVICYLVVMSMGTS